MSLKEKKIEVHIDGIRISSFKNLELSQEINNHHRFKLAVDIETGEAKDTHTIKKSKSWIGKKIGIQYGEKQFLGIISYVGLNREYDANGLIELSGYSNTYLLETAKNIYSWTNKSLTQIVDSVTERAGLKSEVSPEYQSLIEYECQYGESNFEFIQRLAKEYHEWLYYDGQQLVFGKPSSPTSVALEYGSDLDKLDICMETIAKPETTYSYHSLNVETHTGSTPNTPDGLNFLGQAAF